MNVKSAQRFLWIAVAGVVTAIAGVVWDGAWHRRHGEVESGWSEVLEAHWLYFAGAAIVLIGLGLAVRAPARSRLAALATRVAFLAAVALGVGLAWDSAYHARGAESAFGHALIYGGLLLVVAGLVTGLLSNRRPAAVRSP